MKGFSQASSAKTHEELLKLNMNQLECVRGPFTGHCHLKLCLTYNPIGIGCLNKNETASHILSD
jgi:hypothetical protein